ncbi:hypothetical protein LUZ62_042661 [Rhynchospora pubera]|uniref:Uncharacterized protein n=1 Tax=Rhynchospora pubera TaxID=906938 RepID=A0AAV8FIH9_9POAL|nr:hypothetical protein LUZ62_042661 [Rhynchospora pubera]
MSPLKKVLLENPPRAAKVKSLADIYAAEDARKSPSTLNIKSEPLEFEEVSSSFTSEERNLNIGGWSTCEISLKDLRARCKTTKKRKADAELKEADDLDEPLIILKKKRSKSSCAATSKSIVTNAISESLTVQGSEGLDEVHPQLFQEILLVQADCNTASSSNDVTSCGAGVLGSTYHVKTEPQDEIDMTNDSFYSDNESVLEVEPIGSAPSKVDFVAKFDSSCDPSSSLTWLASENIQSHEKVVCSFNKACDDIVESEENLYIPENCEDNLPQSEIMDAEIGESNFPQSKIVEVQDGTSAVAITENMPGCKDLFFSCTVSDVDLYSPGDRQNNLHKSEVMEVGSHASPVTLISPDGKGTFSSNEACNKIEEHVENIYSPTGNQNSFEESEYALVEASKSQVVVTDGATVEALVNTQTDNANNDDYRFLCEEEPNFLDTTNLRSSEGQLESIVYSAMTSSKCFYKKEDDTSTSVNCVLNSPTENSETYSDYGNGVVTKFGEVFEGSNQVECTNIFEMEPSRVPQLCNNLGKEQSSVINDERAKLEKELKGDTGTTTEHAPIKLLSNRTIISPTSQEKLCQALTDIDLHEGTQRSKCKKRILFENCTRMKKCSIITQTTGKVLQKSDGAIQKGNLKSKGAACPTDPFVKMDTEKAIEFSRRQMHDFENVTTKLLKSMKFMKSVLDESLAVQSPWVSEFSAEEIKAASENASRLERTTKKWLTLMSKDCNRFCKILKSAGNGALSPPTCKNGDQNRKKIVFADEAGGVLCHIKVFTETSSPPTAAETEKSDQ